MKRLIILLLLLCSPAYAQDVQIARLSPALVGGGVPAAAALPCPSGTNYLSAWNGDYTGDTDKICYNSKASSKDGTATGATLGTDYGRSGYGLLVDALDERLIWAVTGDDLIDDSIGTICVDVYLNVAAITGVVQIVEAGRGTTNDVLGIYVNNAAGTPYLKVFYYDSVNYPVLTNDTVFPYQTWATVKFTWNQAASDLKVCWSTNCTENLSATMAAWAGGVSELLLGEYRTDNAVTHPVWVDNLRIYAGYDATCE